MLDNRPFSLRDRAFDGVGSRAYRCKEWAVPFRGVRMPRELVGELSARIHAAGLLVPRDSAVGGWAAAALHGDPWSTGVSAAGDDLPIVIFGPRPQAIRPRVGIKPRRASLVAADVVEIGGIRTTTPLRTAFDLARLGRRLDVAVPALDALLRTGTVSLTELDNYVREHPRKQGVPLAREVVRLASPYAESPPESIMRLVWHSIGLGSALVNPTVLDQHGRFVGRVDLLDEDAGLVGEYQGDHHRDRAQYRVDIARKRDLEALGLTVVEAVGGDLGQGNGYSSALVAARSRGLRRDRRLDRWRIGPRQHLPPPTRC